jgi:hypothetical protein
MRIRIFAVVMGLALIASACSSSDSGEAATDAGSSASTTQATGDTAAPGSTTSTAVETAPSAGGDATATVTLDNGEEYTFSILCNLEPQEAAGQEILFTAVSYDEPNGFDVTQFGKGSDDTAGLLDGLGTISIYDSTTYDDVWGAGSVTAQLSQTDFVLELDGTTIRGSGTFFAGEDVANLNLDAGVPGELVANCG